MAASIARPTHKPHKARRPSVKQQLILQTKMEHPDLNTIEIAAIASTDHSHVVKTLQRYGADYGAVKDFKQHRAEIFAGISHRLASSITQQDIEKTPLGSRIMAMGILYDKERLESGLSTANMATLHGDIAALRAQDKAVDNPVDKSHNG